MCSGILFSYLKKKKKRTRCHLQENRHTMPLTGAWPLLLQTKMTDNRYWASPDSVRIDLRQALVQQIYPQRFYCHEEIGRRKKRKMESCRDRREVRVDTLYMPHARTQPSPPIPATRNAMLTALCWCQEHTEWQASSCVNLQSLSRAIPQQSHSSSCRGLFTAQESSQLAPDIVK